MRTKNTAQKKSGKVQFVEWDHAAMQVVQGFNDVLEEQFQGAYVKYAPTIRASERAAVDARGVREKLMAAGAVAVVIAPIVVPDVPVAPLETQWKPTSAEDHVRQWFGDVKAPKQLIAEAVAEALATIGEAGL
jgi:hypothetical protein